MAIPDLEARVTSLLTTRLGIPPEEITRDARLVDDLGMDSLDAVELAIAVERQFGVTVDEEHIAQLKTVADIVTLIQQLSGEGAPT